MQIIHYHNEQCPYTICYGHIISFLSSIFADKMLHRTFVSRLQSLMIYIYICEWVYVSATTGINHTKLWFPNFPHIKSSDFCYFHMSNNKKKQNFLYFFSFGLKDRFMSEYLWPFVSFLAVQYLLGCYGWRSIRRSLLQKEHL